MGSLPFWVIAASSTFFGLFADWLIRRGGHAGNIRRFFVCSGLSGCGALMLAAILTPDALWSNVWLLCACLSMGAWSSNHWAYSQFLAGPETAAKWTGIQNGIGNFAGLIGPMVSGFALKATHNFFRRFRHHLCRIVHRSTSVLGLGRCTRSSFSPRPIGARRPANVY